MISWIKFCPLFVFYTAQIHAAALDKSGQSIRAFLEEGNYIEVSVGQVQSDITGDIPQRETLVEAGVTDFSTSNLVPTSILTQTALKLQLHPKISVGLIYDQPFGAEVGYQMYQPDSAQNTLLESTYFNLQTESLSFLLGFQPTISWNFFTGLIYQTLDAKIQLQGKTFSLFDGYEAYISKDHAFGGVFGLSYQIPEYALKSTLSYHSKIRYQPTIEESITGQSLNFSPTVSSKIETPQSVNIDLQTAISSRTLLYGALRWVDWSKFSIQPTQFDHITASILTLLDLEQDINLIHYEHDQWSTNVGIAHQLSDQWGVSIDAGWDSGTGNVASTLAPIDSLYHSGINARYMLSPKTFFAFGMRYIWLNPADTNNTTTLDLTEQMTALPQATRNWAFAYGFKIGHSF